ncbi:ATP-binding protein [Streptacidiphilus monticola]
MIWPDSAPANPANALQALSSRLRTVLGRESVELTPAGYRLALSPDEIDVHFFRSAATSGDPASALAAWHGDTPDLPAFPDEAARLLSLRRDAAEDLLEAQLASGEDPETLLPDLAARTAAEPLRDRPRALLIRALHRAGRTAEALAAFDEARTLLAEELGADPSPLLREAHQQALTTAPPARDVRNNLPASLTSFLGRERDLATLRATLDSSRLVTLTGPGGTGKTRLAVEAARGVPGAVRLVELAPVSNPAEVPSTVLAALHLRESVVPTTARAHHVAETTDRIIDALGTRDLLLLLDNCEHVIGAAADLAGRLLASCPGLRILATSREPLAITGEQLYPVDPLGLPSDERRLTPEQALAYPAIRLFADRAAAVRPGWTPGEEDLPAVLTICRALDGQPLAIELAAARTRTLEPAAIAERLAQRFSLLTGGSRTALPRHRTLRAVIDWSWELLDVDERALLARLSVFSGARRWRPSRASYPARTPWTCWPRWSTSRWWSWAPTAATGCWRPSASTPPRN